MKPGVNAWKNGKPMTTEEWFWSRVEMIPFHSCWEWVGQNQDGYGRLRINGKRVSATHYSWELHNGRKFPEGMELCHRCDNPPCINPMHLFVGTKSDNQRDSVQKKRHVSTKKTHCANGHEYSAKNTIIKTSSDGKRERRCKICNNAQQKVYRDLRKKNAAK